jgi:superfamily II DNA/RNA helicase
VQELPFRSVAFTGAHKWKSQIEILKEGVDVAVCTPGRLAALLDAGHMHLNWAKARSVGHLPFCRSARAV